MRPVTFFGAAKRSFAFLFGGIWLLCGVPFLAVGLFVGYDTIRQEQRFKTEAQVTDATVLAKWTRRSKNSTTYGIDYGFRAPDGTTIRNEVKVSASLWNQLVERAPVHVTYLVSDPTTNRLEGAGADWVLPAIFTGLGLVFVPIGGVIFFNGLRGISRQLRLQTEGTRADATVVEVAATNFIVNDVAQWRVRYQYQDHRGRTHTGETGALPPEEAEAWQVGDTGLIHFDPNAPTTSIWVGRA